MRINNKNKKIQNNKFKNKNSSVTKTNNTWKTNPIRFCKYKIKRSLTNDEISNYLVAFENKIRDVFNLKFSDAEHENKSQSYLNCLQRNLKQQINFINLYKWIISNGYSCKQSTLV